VLILYLAAIILGVAALFCAQLGVVESNWVFAAVLLAGAMALYQFEFA
jgi:hypothetical protein